MNPTNDPALRSFVPVSPDSDFPIQNLPYGVFERLTGGRGVGVAIGEQVLDLSRLESLSLLDVPALRGRQVFNTPSLNAFLALGREAWSQVRARVSQLLRADEPRLRDDAALRGQVLVPRADVRMLLPVEVGDYTDF